MNIKEKNKKKKPARSIGGFDAVKFMREQRDRISKDIMNLSPEEILEYFERRGFDKNSIKPNS